MAPPTRRSETNGADVTAPAPSNHGVPLSGVEEHFGLAADNHERGVSSTELAPGTDLGGVTIVRLLAEGGMVRVYEGLQHAPSRTVAVKVMRDGFGSTLLVRRFEFEAEVLARLSHPHIAQIHTFGTFQGAEGAVPFFVMEFVPEAHPITAFAASRGLSVRDRVALFRHVCGAVAHGHQLGVVHRDLKPGNILVDGAGEPRVIDFGVARSTEADRAAATAATGAGDLVGTLRYMRPEQLGIDDTAVDARADVYSLGLVLHEMLTGELPYDLRGRSPVEAACLLAGRSGVPLRDMARRFRGPGTAAHDAGQLAVIVGKCLEPQPSNRYATAGALEGDLGRWLQGEPIRARPPTLAESLVRLARRHRTAALAAGTALTALLAAVVGISWFSLRAELRRREALAAWQAADERTAEARGQLYRASLMLATEARDRGNVNEARRLLGQARDLRDAAGPGRAIELDCVAASLDDATAVLDAGGGTPRAVAWSVEADCVAAASNDSRVRVWRRRGGAEASWATAPTVDLVGHDGPVWSLTFAPDGATVASASADGSVRIWDPMSGTERRRLDGHARPVYGVTYSRDGSLLATASEDRTVRLHDTSTWAERIVLRGHGGTVFAASFAMDGTTIATASRDRTARLWRCSDGLQLSVLEGHTGGVLDVAHSPDGALVATGSEDATARVWDAATGRVLAVLDHPLRVNAVAFVGVDRLATAGGDGIVRCWDARRGTELDVFRGHAAAVWSLDTAGGAGRAVTGAEDGTVRLWSLGGDAAAVLRGTRRMLSVAFSPEGSWLAIGGADATVRIHDAGTLQERGTLAVGNGRVSAVAFSADGDTLAAACEDGAVRTWRTSTLAPADVIRAHERRVYSVAFAPRGGRMVTAAEDRTARVLDLGTATRPVVLRHPGRVFCAAFSPDGTTVATACEDRHARLWDAANGRQLAMLSGHEGAVNWVSFSADGRQVATASSDGCVRTWATASGVQRLTMTGPARQVWKVAYAPDGARIAGASADGTVQLWDAESGAPVLMLRGHRDQVWGLAFAASGDAIATASWDGTTRLWGMSAAEIARRRNRPPVRREGLMPAGDTPGRAEEDQAQQD